jgi:sugar/nucleoside kinase (ribokinase family)
LGAKGAIVQQGVHRHDIPAVSVTPVDVIGAGDSFNAGFLHKYVLGRPLAECLVYGNLAAACSTTKPGGTEAFRDPAYWRGFFASHS